MRYRPAKIVKAPEKRISERVVQASVVKLYKSLRCIVFDTSQPHRALITPGVPDLLIFAPRVGRFWFHEVKAADGKPTVEQAAFEELCGSCGVGHVIGGVDAAKNHLRAIGLIAKVA